MFEVTPKNALSLAIVLLVALCDLRSAAAQSGDLVINGTHVLGVVDEGRGVATFSNACGSQTLTQPQLQAGAIPNQIIPCPRNGSGASQPNPTAERQTECQKNWRQGSEQVRQGNAIFDNWDPGGAIPYYERAIGLFNRCGDASNAAIANRNLENARRQYAAVKDDNRIPDALAKYGASSAYDKPGTPFDQIGQGAAKSAPVADVKLAPYDLSRQAAQHCDYVPDDSDARKRCMATQEAQLIMNADPEIKATCGWKNDREARISCALDAYARKLATLQAAAVDRTNCYFDKVGQPCIPGAGGSAAGQGADANATADLRALLRKRLAKDKAAKGDLTPVTDDEVDAAAKVEQDKMRTIGIASPPDPTSKKSDPDDPLQEFLHSVDAGSGGIKTGELGRPDVGGFEAQGYRNRFGIDPKAPVAPNRNTEPTVFDQVHRQYQNRQGDFAQ
jgi:hypothetical protein